jgi:hypothetical protein
MKQLLKKLKALIVPQKATPQQACPAELGALMNQAKALLAETKELNAALDADKLKQQELAASTKVQSIQLGEVKMQFRKLALERAFRRRYGR